MAELEGLEGEHEEQGLSGVVDTTRSLQLSDMPKEGLL